MTDRLEPFKMTREIAAEWKVTEGAVRHWVRLGCPMYRVLGMPRFRASEVREWKAQREAQRETPSARRYTPKFRPGLVYFVGARERWPVKIGWTECKDPSARIPSLQTGAWEHLVCLGSFGGTEADERAAHEALAAYHVRGEWFEREPALTYLAEMLKMELAR